MTAPTIPPRPARAPNSNQSSNPPNEMAVPKIPPRPKRNVDRSVSPHRDTYARSPLNDPSFAHKPHSGSRLSVELPPRPPSVTLPSIGQEGSEYEGLQDYQDTHPEQTKIVAGDLPLHAPTASLPSSAAKSRIATVTRTDSSQAAAAGIGKLFPESRGSHHADSGKSDSSIGRSRPQSIYNEGEEHGIPEIGVQVPMYPNAGDVQAPTPSPYQQGPATGIGFFNKGDHPAGRHHGRTKSGREVFYGPPGSYGLHGHGVIPKDEFEQNWYAKHPEDLKREKQGEYGPHIQENRKEYHWIGDDLAKLVHQSASRGIGMGTSREAIGTPDEQIGYMAAEYASRMASPRPLSSGRPASIKGKSGDHPETGLRHASGPASLEKEEVPEEDAGNDNAVIHIDPPAHRSSKIHGGGYDPPTEDLGPEGGNTEEEGGWISERGYGVPILASDEVAKHPDAEYLQPAVSPELERRGSGEYTLNDPEGVPEYISGRRSSNRTASKIRNANRSGGAPLQRYMSPTEHERTSTPLEHVQEYEPLFPDDEDEKPKKVPVEKLRRPDHLGRYQFPSQDIWEDTPSSLQLETTVETPDVADEPSTPPDVGPVKTFEKPGAEKARQQVTEDDKANFLPNHTKRFAKTGFNKDVMAEMPARPLGLQHRFPSQDIWEDAADHHHLETTVSGPQTEETDENDAVDSPIVAEKSLDLPVRPSVPDRPAKAKETSPVDKKAPVIPDRPKPQVPARPAKPVSKSSEKVPTASTLESHPDTQQPKAKPPVPARPAGSKIAALQAGFLQDLNSKLGLGPQAPKVKQPEPEQEEEKESKPLADARKGRAKGPQRRKPAASPSTSAVEAAPAQTVQKLSFGGVNTIWSIGDDGNVEVPAKKMAENIRSALHIGGPSQESKVSEPRKDQEVRKESHVTEESTTTKVTSQKEQAAENPLTEEEGGVKTETKQSEAKEEGEAEVEEKDERDDAPEEQSPSSSGILGTMKGLVQKVAAPVIGSPSNTEEEAAEAEKVEESVDPEQGRDVEDVKEAGKEQSAMAGESEKEKEKEKLVVGESEEGVGAGAGSV
ncbi:hypothetical protein GQ43DRAFT_427659 [Delitschia confertaspora ATCC 74209]|uniref:Altered inheritance of mitochondria protein 21 n=1 Tax=Delitschia confertaspora ATCC 74209 TaxID=1513339 RepID=A0A9P4JX75_9PLEO|nr:hypothetical protein GQ43DRAFT_427659 [Delitschia confertaspora ATCC 74209]